MLTKTTLKLKFLIIAALILGLIGVFMVEATGDIEWVAVIVLNLIFGSLATYSLLEMD